MDLLRFSIKNRGTKQGRKTYLCAFLDDHSRMVTPARWAYAEDEVRLDLAQTHGFPRSAI